MAFHHRNTDRNFFDLWKRPKKNISDYFNTPVTEIKQLKSGFEKKNSVIVTI